MDQLHHRSIDVILSYQASMGAYPACPSFPTYQYCWFRDGAFIAYAMDLVGQSDSAYRFHAWAVGTIHGHADQAERAIAQAERGEPIQTYLHTRHELNGRVGNDEWPNFQLDGLGTWLWSLNKHICRTAEPLNSDWRAAVELVSCYLATLWTQPCYDLWEEHPKNLHPYTLSAIYAGLRAAASMDMRQQRWLAVAEDIRRFVFKHGMQDGHLVKLITPAEPTHNAGEPSPAPLPRPVSAQVDASLIGAATPYRLLSPRDPVMRATVARIERDLHRTAGGVHRYLADTYYGGGEWILLTAWLGWYYAELRDRDRARELLTWIEAQADADGHLPEQVASRLLAPEYHPQWEARWGPIASPLLWSHAMYLILHRALDPGFTAERPLS
jgi:GH15 family glucan-1,4-alpha-glucosidase